MVFILVVVLFGVVFMDDGVKGVVVGDVGGEIMNFVFFVGSFVGFF